jgi:hypothetical protein
MKVGLARSTKQDGGTGSGITPCPRWLAGDGDGFGRPFLFEGITEVMFCHPVW